MKTQCSKKGIEKMRKKPKLTTVKFTCKNLWMILVLLCQNDQQAAVITYYFDGNLSSPLGTYSTGTRFTGSLRYNAPQSYNPNEPDFVGLPPTKADYVPLEFNLSVGIESLSFTNPSNYKYFSVYNKTDPTYVGSIGEYRGGWGSDVFHFYAEGSQIIGNRRIEFLQIYLNDDSGSAITNLSLPSGDLRLSMFNYNFFDIRYKGGLTAPTDGNPLAGTVSSSLISFVPEPSAISLLSISLGGLAMVRRRRLQ